MGLLTCLVAAAAVPSAGAAPATSVAADKAVLERAAERYTAARAAAELADAKVARATRDLDRIMAAQQRTQRMLNGRARAIYCADDASLVTVLVGADTVEALVSRWAALRRMNEQDAEMLRVLAVQHAQARGSAAKLLRLQEDSARSAQAASREVTEARKRLSKSRAALAAYRRRIAALQTAAPPNADKRPKDATPQSAEGAGAWETAVASHYGINFSGRGASGASIGPYSMICAHKELPFGTLVQFEYRGKRAVARVVDRGPYTPGRDFDLGPGLVRVLGFAGVASVRYRIIGR